MQAEQPGAGRTLAAEDYLLLAAVLLLPWAFGGVEIWAHRSAALLLVASACVAVWKRGPVGLGLVRGAGWLWPAFLLGAWGAAQLVPLPPAVIRVVSPEAYAIYAGALPGYEGKSAGAPMALLEQQALERVDDASAWPLPETPRPDVRPEAPACVSKHWRTISLHPGATAERLAWYVALLLGFLVVRERTRDPGRFRVYRWSLFAVFVALAAFALVQLQFWNGKIYWVRPVLVRAIPFGPYFNPTNLAGVMELAVPAMAGFAWSRLRREGRPALYEAGFGASAAGAAFCMIATVASASKLGVLLVVAGLVALGVLAARRMRDGLVVLAVAVPVAVAGALLMAATRLGDRFEMFVGRMQDVQSLEGRVPVWGAGLDMFRDFPLTGAGFGSFAEVFVRYVPAGSSFRWAHAHNDYVQLLLEGGLVAALLVSWLIVGYTRRVGRSLRSPGGGSPGRIGLVVGAVALAVHALFDFNHQVPANALLWVCVCGLLLHRGVRYGRGGRP
jgi:hypothetical protein